MKDSKQDKEGLDRREAGGFHAGASAAIPTNYPGGLPLYWRNEQSGELAKAVTAYMEHYLDGKPMTEDQIALMRLYLGHWINCPGWTVCSEDYSMHELEHLRVTVLNLKTPNEIQDWIHGALDLGIDPL